jgi:hypothetical protein
VRSHNGGAAALARIDAANTVHRVTMRASWGQSYAGR